MAHNVAVRVEDANLRHRRVRDFLLAAGLAQQALRREGRGQVVVLVTQDRRQNAEASVIHSHDLNGPAKQSSMESQKATDRVVWRRVTSKTRVHDEGED